MNNDGIFHLRRRHLVQRRYLALAEADLFATNFRHSSVLAPGIAPAMMEIRALST